MSMLQTGLLTKVCPYTKAVSQFFSEICVSEVPATAAGYSNIKQSVPECKFSRFKLSINLIEDNFDSLCPNVRDDTTSKTHSKCEAQRAHNNCSGSVKRPTERTLCLWRPSSKLLVKDNH